MSDIKVVCECKPMSHAALPSLAGRSAMTPAFYTADEEQKPLFPGHDAPFVVIHPSFRQIVGSTPSLEIIASSDAPGGDGCAFAHEAGVYMPQTGEVWFASNLYRDGPEGFRNQISKIHPDALKRGREIGSSWDDVSTTPVTANGATIYGNKLLVCSQGLGTSIASALVTLDIATGKEEVLLNNIYGRVFNSVNDVVVLPARADLTTDRTDQHHLPGTTIWFTDPTYGHHQTYKPAPELPKQVYCFDPATGDVRCVADGFEEPNGICFNYEGTKCYVTDTGVVQGDGRGGWSMNGARPSTIYEFDVERPEDPSLSLPRLSNRRVFAFVSEGVPDGIKCDQDGNVYSGCGDGVHVWNKYGTLIGKICLLPDEKASDTSPETLARPEHRSRHCANFCFLPGSRLFILAEDRIYIAQLDSSVKGAL